MITGPSISISIAAILFLTKLQKRQTHLKEFAFMISENTIFFESLKPVIYRVYVTSTSPGIIVSELHDPPMHVQGYVSIDCARLRRAKRTSQNSVNCLLPPSNAAPITIRTEKPDSDQ